jgi:hypothetical protein
MVKPEQNIVPLQRIQEPYKVQKCKTLTILHHNVQSLSNKVLALSTLLNSSLKNTDFHVFLNSG